MAEKKVSEGGLVVFGGSLGPKGWRKDVIWTQRLCSWIVPLVPLQALGDLCHGTGMQALGYSRSLAMPMHVVIGTGVLLRLDVPSMVSPSLWITASIGIWLTLGGREVEKRIHIQPGSG